MDKVEQIASFKRIFLIELAEVDHQHLQRLVDVFRDEQSIYRVIVAAKQDEHDENYHVTQYDYSPTKKTLAEYDRLLKLFYVAMGV